MKSKNRVARSSDHIKDCAALIQQLAYRRPLHRVFSDFVEMSAIAISNRVDAHRQAEREARYLDLARAYTKDELGVMSEMLAIVAVALSERLQDFLGSLFMTLSLGNHWVGQFFTPYSVSQLMAGITVTDLHEKLRSKGYVSVHEPASGGGAMMIAIAEAVADAGYDYRERLHVVAQDLDVTAVHMTYVQLSLIGLPAIVIRGDSLKREVLDVWRTPLHLRDGWDQRLHKLAEPSESSERGAQSAVGVSLEL